MLAWNHWSGITPSSFFFLFGHHNDLCSIFCCDTKFFIQNTNLSAVFLILLQFSSLLQIVLLTVSPSVYCYYFKHSWSFPLGFTFSSWPCILKSLLGFALVFGAAMLSLRRSLFTVVYFLSAICSCKKFSQADNRHKILTPNIHHKSHHFVNQPFCYHEKLMTPIT